MPKCLYAFERRLFGERLQKMRAFADRGDLSLEERTRRLSHPELTWHRPDHELQRREGDGQPRWASWKLLGARSKALGREQSRLCRHLAEQTEGGK